MILTLESAKVILALTLTLACAKAELADDLDRVGSAAGQLKQKDAKEEDRQHGTEADQQACGSRFAARRLGRRHWGVQNKNIYHHSVLNRLHTDTDLSSSRSNHHNVSVKSGAKHLSSHC